MTKKFTCKSARSHQLPEDLSYIGILALYFRKTQRSDSQLPLFNTKDNFCVDTVLAVFTSENTAIGCLLDTKIMLTAKINTASLEIQ